MDINNEFFRVAMQHGGEWRTLSYAGAEQWKFFTASIYFSPSSVVPTRTDTRTEGRREQKTAMFHPNYEVTFVFGATFN